MNYLDPPIGFMQGRLTDLYENRIQSFPWDNWEKEFELANKYNFKIMEWTIDSENLFKNPLMNDEGLDKINYLKKKYCLSIPSLTGDCFMQQPFWKSEGALKNELENKFIKVCENASKINIKFIVVPLVDNGSINSRKEENNLLQFLKSIENKLYKLNLKIIFETNFTPKRYLDFINKLNPMIFGINFDMGNSASLAIDPEEEITLLGNRIWNVHIKDRELNGSTIELGKGNVNFEKVFLHLSRIKYKGNFILQTARSNNNKHMEILLKYRNFTKNYMLNLI